MDPQFFQLGKIRNIKLFTFLFPPHSIIQQILLALLSKCSSNMTASYHLYATILVKGATISHLSNFNSTLLVSLILPILQLIPLPAPGDDDKSKQSDTRPFGTVLLRDFYSERNSSLSSPLPIKSEVMNKDPTRLDIKLQPLGYTSFKLPNERSNNLYPGMITEGSNYVIMSLQNIGLQSSFTALTFFGWENSSLSSKV